MQANNTEVLPAGWLTNRIIIHLIGVGGTGSQVLTCLARLHLALRALGHPHGLQVTVFDPDSVSESNIGRQLFAPSEIGRNKAVALVTRINTWYGLGWQAVPHKWQPPRGCDLVISCVDTAATRREIASVIDNNPYYGAPYWLDCGNAQQSGQVFLTRNLNHKESRLPQMRDVLPEIFDESLVEDNRPSCSLAEALESQGLYVNQHMATWACTLLEKFFREGKLSICGYWINLETGSVVAMPIPEKKRTRTKVKA
jgi:PRTRC genetic system ThiF family protein